MSRRARGLWAPAAVGVIAVVVVAGMVAVWGNPHRADLEAFGGLAISVAGIAAGWIAWIWRHQDGQGSGIVSGEELGRLADLLARTVDAEWTRAAGERGLLEPEPIPVRWQRPAAPVAGPTTAAVASRRFAPLPGLAAAGEQQLVAGQVRELHDVYGGLGSGRLIIAGGPGSGKSSAAVLLVLTALRYRRSVPEKARPKVPVPVMFTLHGWYPGTQRAGDWLAERLWRTYPLFAGRHGEAAARAMLEEGRIAVILDGLDEIPENVRPAALRALSQQATFRMVLLTRSAEMADAAAQALLQGAAAVELQDIDPVTAADYLTRTQLDPPAHGWRELTSRLHQDPGGPLARALNSPLMLTLVRDTYRAGDDVGELLGLQDAAGHPASSGDIADRLLDRVLLAAYTQQPGGPAPRYDLPTAERALRRIATRMNNDGIRDLQWWHVPAWADPAPRFIATCLGPGLVAGLAAALAGGLAGGSGLVAGPGLVAGLAAALVAGLAYGRGNKTAKRRAPVQWRQLFQRKPLVVGLLAGLAFGLVAWNEARTALELKNYVPMGGLGAWLGAWPGGGLVAGLLSGLAFGFVAWLGAGLVAGMSRPGTDNTSPLNPLSSWRSDRAFGLVAGLVAGLVVGLAAWLVAWLAGGLVPGQFVAQPPGAGAGLAFGLVAGLVAGPVAGLVAGLVYPRSWSSSLAFVQLAASDRTPVRLMRFLEDARSRGVLRTVGPVYQFRHARLQDRLANQELATGQSPSEPGLAPEPAPPTAQERLRSTK